MSKDILEQILIDKRAEVDNLKKTAITRKDDLHIDKPSFLHAFKKGTPVIIGEVKKASPSRGIIRDNFNHIEIAKTYEKAGIGAISVLTDEKYFMGNIAYLKEIRKEVNLPLLRKDFIIDPYQIEEAFYAGASAILLIAAILSDKEIKEYIHMAESLSIDVLVETHNQEDINKAINAGANIIGINNRDLRTFKTDISLTQKLLYNIPKDKIVISESGINKPYDISYLTSLGVDGFLIGEAFMKENDIEKKIKEMLN